jgi:glucosamine-6-phosphate deaminase
MSGLLRAFAIDRLAVEVYASKAELGRGAAARAASLLIDAITQRGRARIIVGTGPSQNETIAALTETPAIDWKRVDVFHMDEYVGLPAGHPASFRRWLKEHLVERVNPGAVHYLNGDAADAAVEAASYAAELARAPIDVCFVGFGENGHIAFNDPHVADFRDPAAVKVVEMDERCRLQQVGEGHFPRVQAVPRFALTLTCPALLAAAHLICSVPDRRKAEAVRNALEGPVAALCPASVVRTHPDVVLYLEPESASLLRAVGEVPPFSPGGSSCSPSGF